MSKVACETAAALTDAGAVQSCDHGGAGSASAGADDAGAPADSVLLRVPDGGVGLTHLLFGAALRRDGSTKGSSNPKAAAEAATRKGAPRADSRRSPAATTTASSSKTATLVIGVLPASSVVVAKERRGRGRAPGRAVVAHASWRRPAAGARVFASEAVGSEPVSPKVSCFGAVLSETERSAAAPPAGTQEEEEQGSGCWASLRTALLGLSASEPTPKAAAAPEPQRVAVMSPLRPVARLGDMKRLASRRWPGTV